MPTCFENIQKPDNVAFGISAGIGQRVTNTSLCRQVDDSIEIVLSKNRIDLFLVREIGFDQGELVKISEL